MPSPTSLKCLLDEVSSAIEVECPNERFAPRGAHESSSLQHRSHALRTVNKGPKLLAGEPQPEVLQQNQSPPIPTVSGIGEREQLARPPRCLPEQRLSVRVAANHTVERHHVGVGQGACNHGEV